MDVSSVSRAYTGVSVGRAGLEGIGGCRGRVNVSLD